MKVRSIITHIIYLIPDTKVRNAPNNLSRRKHEYKEKLGFVPIIAILEQLCDHTHQQAGDREWWWAEKLGYKRGLHYVHTMKAISAPNSYATVDFAAGSAAGRLGGAIAGMISPAWIKDR